MGASSVSGPDGLDRLCRMADAGVRGEVTLPAGAHDLPLDDPLNDYVEAHVHGGLDVARDVEALVLDPSDEQAYGHLAERLGCIVEVHAGYSVTADRIDPDYRGPVPVDLARTLGGEVTPARLAAAARSGDYPPQSVKWLWHCLARFGRA